ncbi:hypothetical protein [Flammeovirga agarivorans]|uniref:Uncharacterized protein n=1 Tax=Flammeovirga agarivorans TaxID=2726742 RepID=A0A7X8XUX8_9BACT|nr:hypothetical protein [Flammeovirga agarivorans]NLR90783.1 hypothetical protein [Flammeovirga agarivorans]
MNYIKSTLLLLIFTIGFISCDNEENPIPSNQPIVSKSYKMIQPEEFTYNGTVNLEEDEDGKIILRVTLDQAASEEYQVQLYNGSIDLSATSIETLTPIAEGETESITDLSEKYTYQELTQINAHLRVIKKENDLNIESITELGTNEFDYDGEKTYEITNASGEVVGYSTFIPRTDGPMLVGVNLVNPDNQYEYVIDLYEGTKNSGVKTDNPFIELANIPMFSDNNSYTNLPEEYSTPASIEDAFLLIEKKPIVQGEGYYGKADVGGNELTGEVMMYDFAKPGSEDFINGWVKFEERVNGNVLFSHQMTGDSKPYSSFVINLNDDNYFEQGVILAHLGKTKVDTDEVIYFDLRERKDGTPITYNEIISSEYSVRMNKDSDPEYNGTEYFALSDVGTSALNGTHTISVFNFNHIDYSGEEFTIEMHERINGMAFFKSSYSEFLEESESYRIYLYEGTDYTDESAAQVALVGILDERYNDPTYEEDIINVDVNGDSINYDQLLERAGHYRLIRQSDEEVIANGLLK